MSSIPSNLSRVPNLLSSQLFLTSLTRTNLSLLGLQSQMATGRAVNRPSDDAVRASAISVLDDHLERAEQRLRNLSAANATLNLLDSSIGDASDLVLQAKNIASSQIGTGSDAATRRNQAIVIDSLIRQAFDLGNRQTNGLYLFGGSTPSRPPIEEFLGSGAGGFRYVGRGSGLLTDLGLSENIPVTLGGNSAPGQLSARLRSTIDLNPALTPGTPLADLHGARGLGVSLGNVSMTFNGGPTVQIDLSGAVTAQDVVNSLTDAVRGYETANGVTILGPAGISVANGGFMVDVVGGGGGPDPLLRFADIGQGLAAADLGLTTPFSITNSSGTDLNPKLTMLTPVGSLPGLPSPLGEIRLRFSRNGNSAIRDVDLSSARTIDDIRNLIQVGAPGVRVEINDAGTGLNIFNEIAGPSLSIEEIPGGSMTATALGLRSMTGQTPVSALNNGRGVRVLSGIADPNTGAVTRDRNLDFAISIDGVHTFEVDLRPQDLVSIQGVIDRLNQEAADAVADGRIPAGSFSAGLSDGANGIALFGGSGVTGITVSKLNNSAAAEDLGLLDGVFDPASATFTAQDRAGIRVDNLFTTLMDLRDALLNNDSVGITIAGGELDGHVDRLAQTHALVGVYSERVQRAAARQEDQKVLDLRVKSEFQDLDFTEASIRFSLLQTQLQAGLQVAGLSQTRTLLDFLR